MKRSTMPIALAFLLLSLSASAMAQNLTFEELPFQAVDDLKYAGVQFDYKINGADSGEAFFGSYGPGDLTFVSDPSLTGKTAGILALTFDMPTTLLEFGVAMNTGGPLTPGYTVELFDAGGQSLGTSPVNTAILGGVLGFSEGKFTYSGPAASRAVVDFVDQPSSFALDNLVYQVPEPSGVLLFVPGLLVFACPKRFVRDRSRSALANRIVSSCLEDLPAENRARPV